MPVFVAINCRFRSGLIYPQEFDKHKDYIYENFKWAFTIPKDLRKKTDFGFQG